MARIASTFFLDADFWLRVDDAFVYGLRLCKFASIFVCAYEPEFCFFAEQVSDSQRFHLCVGIGSTANEVFQVHRIADAQLKPLCQSAGDQLDIRFNT